MLKIVTNSNLSIMNEKLCIAINVRIPIHFCLLKVLLRTLCNLQIKKYM